MNIRRRMSGVVFILVAVICGVLIAIWVFRYFSIYIPLENQAVYIDLQAPLQAKVQIHDALEVDVSGEVSAVIPINETLDIPLTQTLKPHIYFDNQVPIKTTIPVKEVLKIAQDMPIDTKVTVTVMGQDVTLPLKGTIPINLEVPIDLKVPLNQIVHLKFDAPVKTVIKENLQLPFNVTLNTKIPIQGHLNVPVKTALDATVDVKNTLPIKIQQGQLKIPLSSMKLSENKGAALTQAPRQQAQQKQVLSPVQSTQARMP